MAYRFVGAEAGDFLTGQTGIASVPDIDGDGKAEYFLGAPLASNRAGEVYLIFSQQLVALDGADGATDETIDLSYVDGSYGYTFTGAHEASDLNDPKDWGAGTGFAVAAVADKDAGSTVTLMIGAWEADTSNGNNTGAAYLISQADLATLDAADGSDGRISLANVGATHGGYVIEGAPGTDPGYEVEFGTAVGSAGFFDADNKADFFIGAMNRTVDGKTGTAYLINAAELSALDGDGDRVINAADIGGTAGGRTIVGEGPGAAAANAYGMGRVFSPVGDYDGDGKGDYLVGGYPDGEVWLVTRDALDEAGPNDPVTQGDVTSNGGYVFQNSAGRSVLALNDPDGIGAGALFFGAGFDDTAGLNAGAAYYIPASALAALDAASGTDGIINLADVVGTNGVYQFQGAAEGDRAGLSITTTQVDGDGTSDLVIGAWGADANGEDSGSVYLIPTAVLSALDTADGQAADGVINLADVGGANGYVVSAAAAYSEFGLYVTNTPDTGTDGQPDLLIGARNADGNGVDSGAVVLLRPEDLVTGDAADGSTDGRITLDTEETAENYTFFGGSQGARAASSITSLGDIDGDGAADFLIGADQTFYETAPDTFFFSGAAYVVHAADLRALDTADGAADQVINLGYVGATHGGYTFFGAGDQDRAGASVALVDDVDGAGAKGLLIGAYANDAGISDGGAAYLVPLADLAALDAADSSTDGVIDLGNVGASHGGYAFVGPIAGGQAGYSVTALGDFDGDGKSDFLIGAQENQVGPGSVYLVASGDLATLDGADGADGVIDLGNVDLGPASYTFTGIGSDDLAGRSVSALGDDGLLIGARFGDGGGGSSGDVFMIRAGDLAGLDGVDGTDGVIALDNVGPYGGYRFEGERSSAFTEAVADVGDVDGDGVADFLIGATGALEPAIGNAGAAYLITSRDLENMDTSDGGNDNTIRLAFVGGSPPIGTPGGYVFVGATDEDDAGFSVASAGDVDGDGVNDFLIGDTAAEGTGRTYLIRHADLASLDLAYGNPADGSIWLADVGPTHGGYVFEGVREGDLAGYAVSSAGDVDKDGRADLLISAREFDGSALNSGAVHLIRASTLDTLDEADGIADGRISFGNTPLCFVRGTAILTARGMVAVEVLAPGDLVATLDHGLQPLCWVGRTSRPATGKMAPVRIAAGALGNTRDLWVSPQHRMLLRRADGGEVFAPAIHLVDGGAVAQVEGGTVEYFHIMFDRHQVVFAEGALAESFFPGPEAWKALSPEARAELRALFPELAPEAARPARGRPGPGAVPGFGALARSSATRREARGLMMGAL